MARADTRETGVAAVESSAAARGVPPWTPTESDIGDVLFVVTGASLLLRATPSHGSSQRRGDADKDGRKEEEIDQLRIELSTASLEQDLASDIERLGAAVATPVRDGVEGIGDGYDTRRERDPTSGETARISSAVPALMM